MTKGSSKPAEGGKVSVHIPELREGTLHLRLTGTTSLITHAWSSKAKKQILDKQMKTPSSGRDPKCPEEEFIESMYWLDGEKPTAQLDEKTGIKTYDLKKVHKAVANAKFGMKACAFKAATVGACRFVDGMEMTKARGIIRIFGAEDPAKVPWNPTDFVLIQGDKPVMREDMVVLPKGVADIRFRGEFINWWTDIRVVYNAGFFSAAQVVNLIRLAGFGQGVGEWRMEKDGDHGCFDVSGL